MITTQETNRIEETEEAINIQELLLLCLGKWYWFAASVVVTLGVAVFYLLVTPPVYTRQASLLIKETSKGQSLGNEVGAAFSDMGIFQSNTNVNNELIALQSPAVMLDVVKRLRLDVNYSTDGTFYKKTLYGLDLPLTVQFQGLADSENVGLTVTPLADGKSYLLSDFIKDGETVGQDSTFQVKMEESVATPVGTLSLIPTPYVDSPLEGALYVSRVNYYATVTRYMKNLSVELANKQASVINLSFKDVSIQRAEELLNTLIAIYNENWVKDKNQIAISTSMFINDRLSVIEKELGSVDSDISSYKSEHLLPDVQAASNLYMTQSTETETQIMEINNQLSMARYIRNYLSNINSKDQLLPVNSGLESANIESQISEYNTKQLQRNNLVANSSEQNPSVIDLDHSLQSMRRAIVVSIDNLVTSLNTQLRALEQKERYTTSRISDNPNQAKYLLSVERQQKVKESLYLFLLQKREENELSQAFTAYNSRVITPPSGELLPTAPVKRNILLIAFVLGLLIPVAIIYLLESMNTKLRGRKDLENLSVPFVGEIPSAFKKERKVFWRKHQEKKVFTVVVKERSRNVINEAFRVVRTNLEFMGGAQEGGKVIMVTSANPNSGKTFIAYNLATSLAIKGKRVIVIDLDMRMASMSESVGKPKVGISGYLAGQVDQIQDIVCKPADTVGLDVIPVGMLPPNPTELLFSKRLEILINDLRQGYDYVFIDCPPVEIVADASIVNKLVDQTLFVVRVGLLERAMLPEIDRFYTEKRYKNMALLLNGTDSASGRYGYKYGYRYGYHYGGYANEKE